MFGNKLFPPKVVAWRFYHQRDLWREIYRRDGNSNSIPKIMTKTLVSNESRK